MTSFWHNFEYSKPIQSKKDKNGTILRIFEQSVKNI